MSSLKQIEANRLNAQKSTGPKTPEGKAASCRNALKHGFTAEQLLLPNESKEEYEELAAQLREEYQPTNPTEELLVSQLIAASWNLRRYRILEGDYLRLRWSRFAETVSHGDEPNQLPHIFYHKDWSLDAISRMHARAERSFYRALHELQRIQAPPRPRQVPAPPREHGNGITPQPQDIKEVTSPLNADLGSFSTFSIPADSDPLQPTPMTIK